MITGHAASREYFPQGVFWRKNEDGVMTWRRIIGGTEGNVEMGNVEDKTRVVIECSWLLSVLTWGTLRWMPEEAMWERCRITWIL
ncbi:hypothetical protein V6N12_028431 [Hibiscus sabdariffa]|uniref:Uncharacterized protein n=1 Tax=Hibiscus sabdariffa TaxID=183260 RepID=A0ABR2F5T4_9ROSI